MDAPPTAIGGSTQTSQHPSELPGQFEIAARNITSSAAVDAASTTLYVIGFLLTLSILLSLAYKQKFKEFAKSRLDRAIVFLITVFFVWSSGTLLSSMIRFFIWISNTSDESKGQLFGIIEMLDAPFATAVAILVFGANLLLAMERYFTIKQTEKLLRDQWFYAAVIFINIFIVTAASCFVRIDNSPNSSIGIEIKSTQPSPDGYIPGSDLQATIWLVVMGLSFLVTIVTVSHLYAQTYKLSAELLRISLADCTLKAFQEAAEWRGRPSDGMEDNLSANSDTQHGENSDTHYYSEDRGFGASMQRNSPEFMVGVEFNTHAMYLSPNIPENMDVSSHRGSTVVDRDSSGRQRMNSLIPVHDPMSKLEEIEKTHFKAERTVLIQCLLMCLTLYVCYLPTVTYELARLVNFLGGTDLDPKIDEYSTWYQVGNVCLSLDPVVSSLLLLYIRTDLLQALKDLFNWNEWKRQMTAFRKSFCTGPRKTKLSQENQNQLFGTKLKKQVGTQGEMVIEMEQIPASIHSETLPRLSRVPLKGGDQSEIEVIQGYSVGLTTTAKVV